MDEMAESSVVKRLIRSIRYRRTYIVVFETFLSPDPHPVVVRLLNALIETQHTAAVTLSNYLGGLGIDAHDLSPYRRLMDQAAQHQGLSSRLRFVHHGLRRGASWYKMQLTDKRMTADPELEQILLDLGQSQAAKLWRVEAIMAMLRIPLRPESEVQREHGHFKPQRAADWRSHRMENVQRPSWKGRQSAMLPRPSHSGHND
jgi:hypothetical protein